jgi:cell division septal protein FtsQ
MDILAKLRVLFWGLVIGLWGLFMYQFLYEDISMPQFRLSKNPFTRQQTQTPEAILKRNLQRQQQPPLPP